MTARQSRTVLSLAFVALVLAIAAGLASLYHLGVAHADSGSAVGSGSDFVVIPPAMAPAPAPDPVATVTADTASIGDLFVQYGPLWGGAFLIFGLATYLLAKNESQHWLAQGRALAGVTSALMVGGALLRWKFGGAAIGAALTPVLALVKLFNPLGPAAVRKLATNVAALILGGAIGFGAMSQTACKGPVPVPVTDLIDCVKAEGTADWPTIVVKLSPDLGDWQKLVADVTSLAPKYALDIVECVGKELVSQYLSVAHEGAEASTESAHDAGEAIRDLVAKQLAQQRASAGLAAPARRVLFHSKLACPQIPAGCDL